MTLVCLSTIDQLHECGDFNDRQVKRIAEGKLAKSIICTYVKRAKMATTLATRSKETSSDLPLNTNYL